MTSPTFVLLTGPSGSGKSTAAAAWAERGSSPRALLDVDRLRALMRAGFAHPEHGWTDETERQWNIGIELCGAMARVYRANDVSCIIDIYAPPFAGDPWAALADELDAVRVALLPTLDVCLTRNAKRAREPFLEPADLTSNYEDFAYCVRTEQSTDVIDNSTLTVDQTVDRIDEIVASHLMRHSTH